MFNRIQYLESLIYQEEYPFFADDLQITLQRMFEPYTVDDLSDMDNSYSYEFLVAINNEGFFSHTIELEAGVSMHTMDDAIKGKDLYYLNIMVSTEKPFATALFLKYTQGDEQEAPVVSKLPFDEKQAPFFDTYLLFLNEYQLCHVSYEDLNETVKWDTERVSFYYRYFNPNNNHVLEVPF